MCDLAKCPVLCRAQRTRKQLMLEEEWKKRGRSTLADGWLRVWQHGGHAENRAGLRVRDLLPRHQPWQRPGGGLGLVEPSVAGDTRPEERVGVLERRTRRVRSPLATDRQPPDDRCGDGGHPDQRQSRHSVGKPQLAEADRGATGRRILPPPERTPAIGEEKVECPPFPPFPSGSTPPQLRCSR